MRRFALVLTAAALLAAACDSSTAPGHHWLSTSSTSHERTIHVTMTPELAADASFWRAAQHGVTVWDRSPYIDFVLRTSPCPDGAHCIGVTRRSMNGASASLGWDDSLHMYGNGANLAFDSAPWDQPVGDNAWCHELGHALGLDHSPFEGVEGPCQGGVPTDHDYGLIADLYSHHDGGTSTTVESSTDARGGGSERHADTRAELREAA